MAGRCCECCHPLTLTACRDPRRRRHVLHCLEGRRLWIKRNLLLLLMLRPPGLRRKACTADAVAAAGCMIRQMLLARHDMRMRHLILCWSGTGTRAVGVATDLGRALLRIRVMCRPSRLMVWACS